MKLSMEKYWDKVLHIGYTTSMNNNQQMKLFVVNAFLCISLVLTVLFVSIFCIMGSYSALQGIAVIPIIFLVFLLNAKRKFKAARFVVTYGLMLIALGLSLADRRTGTEYLLIAIGCCSVIVFEQIVSIVASFFFAFACYVTYVWIDATLPFTPDPTVPYLITQNSLMFLSGFIVMAQSLVFRSLINKYSESLQQANNEIQFVNEELKASNEELQAFSENLDLLVRKKSSQLQAYVDALNTNICAVTLDSRGKFKEVNDPFVLLGGYAREELMGKHYTIFNSGQHVVEFLSARDNSLLYGKAWTGELKYRRKDGSYFWIDCVVMPLKQDDGTVIEFLSLGIPITERKLAEQIKEQTQKLLETIAFKTSHKIRGPLATIQGLTNLLQKKLVSQQEFELIAQRLASTNDELKEATSELVRFVNQQDDRDQALN